MPGRSNTRGSAAKKKTHLTKCPNCGDTFRDINKHLSKSYECWQQTEQKALLSTVHRQLAHGSPHPKKPTQGLPENLEGTKFDPMSSCHNNQQVHSDVDSDISDDKDPLDSGDNGPFHCAQDQSPQKREATTRPG